MEPVILVHGEPQLRTDVSATRLRGELDTNRQVTSKKKNDSVIN